MGEPRPPREERWEMAERPGWVVVEAGDPECPHDGISTMSFAIPNGLQEARCNLCGRHLVKAAPLRIPLDA